MTQPASAMFKETAGKCRAAKTDDAELRKLLDLAACDLESAATLVHHHAETQNAVAAERERCASMAEGSWINVNSPWAERNGAAKVDAHNAACAQIARSIRHI